ncbi:CsbD family protein [Azorhizobium doebereinerae]|uniref:CsbD family protein n=1 Tax=Azorhizobium doebereinerae TaxID=281091 RepID=UPI0004189AD6|nr:CsbD family protein [Azorhizobium doebereinerae]
MDKDTITGAATEAGGRVKEAAGALSGSAGLKAEGLYDQVAGGAQRALGEAKDTARQGARTLGHGVERRPLPALLTAGLLGFALGVLFAR